MTTPITILAPPRAVRKSLIALGNLSVDGLDSQDKAGGETTTRNGSCISSSTGHNSLTTTRDLCECRSWLTAWLACVTVQTLLKHLDVGVARWCGDDKSLVPRLHEFVGHISLPTRLACIVDWYAPAVTALLSGPELSTAGRGKANGGVGLANATISLTQHLSLLRSNRAISRLDLSLALQEDNSENIRFLLAILQRFTDTLPPFEPVHSKLLHIIDLVQRLGHSHSSALYGKPLNTAQELRLTAEFYALLVLNQTDSFDCKQLVDEKAATRISFKTLASNAPNSADPLRQLVRTSGVVARSARPAHPDNRPIALLNTAAVDQLVSSSSAAAGQQTVCAPTEGAVSSPTTSLSTTTTTRVAAGDPMAVGSGSAEVPARCDDLLLADLARTASVTMDSAERSVSRPFLLTRGSHMHGYADGEGINASSLVSSTGPGNGLGPTRSQAYATFRKRPTPALSGKLPNIDSPVCTTSSEYPDGSVPSTKPRTNGVADIPSLRDKFESRRRAKSVVHTPSPSRSGEDHGDATASSATTTWAKKNRRGSTAAAASSSSTSVNAVGLLGDRGQQARAGLYTADAKDVPRGGEDSESKISSSIAVNPTGSTATLLRLSLEQRRRQIELNQQRAREASHRAGVSRRHAAFQRLLQQKKHSLGTDSAMSTSSTGDPKEPIVGQEELTINDASTISSSGAVFVEATATDEDVPLVTSTSTCCSLSTPDSCKKNPSSTEVNTDGNTGAVGSEHLLLEDSGDDDDRLLSSVDGRDTHVTEASVLEGQLGGELSLGVVSGDGDVPTEAHDTGAESADMEQQQPEKEMVSATPVTEANKATAAIDGWHHSGGKTRDKVSRSPVPEGPARPLRTIRRTDPRLHAAGSNNDSGEDVHRLLQEPQRCDEGRRPQVSAHSPCLQRRQPVGPPPTSQSLATPVGISYYRGRSRVLPPRHRSGGQQQLAGSSVDWERWRRRCTASGRNSNRLGPGWVHTDWEHEEEGEYFADEDEGELAHFISDEGSQDEFVFEEEEPRAPENWDRVSERSHAYHTTAGYGRKRPRASQLMRPCRVSHRNSNVSLQQRPVSPAFSVASSTNAGAIDPTALAQINRNLSDLQLGLERLSMQQQQLLLAGGSLNKDGSHNSLSLLLNGDAVARRHTVGGGRLTSQRATWDLEGSVKHLAGPQENCAGRPMAHNGGGGGGDADAVDESLFELRQQTASTGAVVAGEEEAAVTSTSSPCSGSRSAKKQSVSVAAVDSGVQVEATEVPVGEGKWEGDPKQTKKKNELAAAAPANHLFFIGFDDPDPQRIQRKCDQLEARRAAEKALAAQQLQQLREQQHRQMMDERRRAAERKAVQDKASRTSNDEPSALNPYPVRSGAAALLSRSDVDPSVPPAPIKSGSTAPTTASGGDRMSRMRRSTPHGLGSAGRHGVCGLGQANRARPPGKTNSTTTTRSSGDGQAGESNPDDDNFEESRRRQAAEQAQKPGNRRAAGQLASGLSLSSLHRLGMSEANNNNSNVQESSTGQPRLFVKPKAKSNRMVIVNAIGHCCLAGAVNEPVKQATLKELAATEGTHFMILFRDSRLQYRAVYFFDLDLEELRIIYGTGPRKITHDMASRFYKYNSGGKHFSEIVSTSHLSPAVDAITIHDALWSRPSGQSAAINLVSSRLLL